MSFALGVGLTTRFVYNVVGVGGGAGMTVIGVPCLFGGTAREIVGGVPSLLSLSSKKKP